MQGFDRQDAVLLWSPIDASPETGFREYLERVCHSIDVQAKGILSGEGRLEEFPKINLTRTLLCDVLSLLVAYFPRQVFQEEKAVSFVFGKHYLSYVAKTVPTSPAKHECLPPDPCRILEAVTRLSRIFSLPPPENLSYKEEFIRIVKFVVNIMETARIPVPTDLKKASQDPFIRGKDRSPSSLKKSSSFLRKVGFFERLESCPALRDTSEKEISRDEYGYVHKDTQDVCKDRNVCKDTISVHKDTRDACNYTCDFYGNVCDNVQIRGINHSPILADIKDATTAVSTRANFVHPELPAKNTISGGLSLLKSKLSNKSKSGLVPDGLSPARCKSMRETHGIFRNSILHEPPHSRRSCATPCTLQDVPHSQEVPDSASCTSEEEVSLSRKKIWPKSISLKNLVPWRISPRKRDPENEECGRKQNSDIFLCDEMCTEPRPGRKFTDFLRKFKRSSIVKIRPGSINPEDVIPCEESVKELNIYSPRSFVDGSDELPKLFVSDRKHMKKVHMEVFKIHNKSSTPDARSQLASSNIMCLCALRSEINQLTSGFLKKKLDFNNANMKTRHLITENMKHVTKRIDLAEQALLSFESFRCKKSQVHNILPIPSNSQEDSANKALSERSKSVNVIRRTSTRTSRSKPLNRFLSIRAMPAVSIHICSRNVQNAWRVTLSRNAVSLSKKRLEIAKLFANMEVENLRLLVNFYKKILLPLLSSESTKILVDLQYALYHLDDIVLISTRVLQKLIWVISKWSLNSDICQVYYVLSKNIFPYIYLSANSVISSALWERMSISSNKKLAPNASVWNSIIGLPNKCLNKYALMLKALNDYSEYGNTVKICQERFRTILDLSKSLKRGSQTILYLDSIVPLGVRMEVDILKSFLIHTCYVAMFNNAINPRSEELDLKKISHDHCFVLTSNLILLARKPKGIGACAGVNCAVGGSADAAPVDTLVPKTLSYSWHAKLEDILEASHFVNHNKYFMSFTYCSPLEGKETSNAIMFSREEDRNIVYKFFSESYPHVIVKKLVMNPDESPT